MPAHFSLPHRGRAGEREDGQPIPLSALSPSPSPGGGGE